MSTFLESNREEGAKEDAVVAVEMTDNMSVAPRDVVLAAEDAAQEAGDKAKAAEDEDVAESQMAKPSKLVTATIPMTNSTPWAMMEERKFSVFITNETQSATLPQ